MDTTTAIEIVGSLGTGATVSAVLTYLAVRHRAASGLEVEYMKRFDDAMRRADERETARDERDATKDQRISKLEERCDRHEEKMIELIQTEREKCDEELRKLENKLRGEFDERISSVSRPRRPDETL